VDHHRGRAREPFPRFPGSDGQSQRIRDYPEINGYLISTLASRLREADEELAAASFLTVKARVARALLDLAEHRGRETEPGRITIFHKIRQNDVAAMAGVARENVSRTLTEWKRRGLIGQSVKLVFHQRQK
jgi:CRP/FNR family transcriptional regulator, cyclic AMP receptor protein